MPRPATLLFFAGFLAAVPSSRAALDIRFDYTYDTGGFFLGANSHRQKILDAAAAIFEKRLAEDSMPALVPPTPDDRWTLTFSHPGTLGNIVLPSPTIQADVITIYVGGESLTSTNFAEGSSTVNLTGVRSPSWIQAFDRRNSSANYDSLGGSITFNSSLAWYSDADTSTVEAFEGQFDLFSAAQREIAGILGFDTRATAFMHDAASGRFAGDAVLSLFGGPVPLSADGEHWVNGFVFNGVPSVMTAELVAGQRAYFTELDFAVLADIGYKITPAPVPEPAVLSAMGFGAALLATMRRHPRRKHTP